MFFKTVPEMAGGAQWNWRVTKGVDIEWDRDGIEREKTSGKWKKRKRKT